MNKRLQQYTSRFNAQSLRERLLVALTLLTLLAYAWWSFFAEPMMQTIEARQQENQRIDQQLKYTRDILREVRQRIATGIYQQKEKQLVRLSEELAAVERQLRDETVELIDPEKMLQLMSQLIYSESRLKLLSFKRREVRPAIPRVDGEESAQPGIFRHVLEIELEGKYVDILKYMQTLEGLDWKLLWDEIEIFSEKHPQIRLRLVMSTLSTRREWIGI